MTFDDLTTKHPRLFANAPWSNCPPGWLPLLAELCERLDREHPDVEFSQVKDKFAALRIYTQSGTAAADDLISEYERRSAVMCEECGAQGKRTTRGGWLVVRCEEHAP